MVIAVDFDGTCVTHEFPMIGRDIGAVPVLKELVSKGHKIILFTMRSHKKPRYLELDPIDEAIKWFSNNGIPLYGVNENPTQKFWTYSKKADAHLYIDDAALGCPLVYQENGRPYVDWIKVREYLVSIDVL